MNCTYNLRSVPFIMTNDTPIEKEGKELNIYKDMYQNYLKCSCQDLYDYILKGDNYCANTIKNIGKSFRSFLRTYVSCI